MGALRPEKVYLRVFKDRMSMVNLLLRGRTCDAVPPEPFTTQRLLIGRFDAAERCLRDGLARVVRGGWLRPRPHVLVQPMAMTEGGLSQIEQRAFTELAYGAGAGRAVVWVGDELADEEALAKLDGKP